MLGFPPGFQEDQDIVSCHEPECSGNVTDEKVLHGEFIISSDVILHPHVAGAAPLKVGAIY